MVEEQGANVYRLCVILLVVLSGCAGIGVDTADRGTSSETVTPVPVPAGDRETLRSSGINDSGVSDPGALADAHREWLADRSYSLVSNQVVRYQDGSLRSQYLLRLELAENRTYHAVLRTAGPEGLLVWEDAPAVSKFWSDGQVFFRGVGDPVTSTDRFTQASNIARWQFWTTQGVFGPATTPGEVINRSFEAIPTRIDERRTSGDAPRYRVTGSESGPVELPFPEAYPARDVSLVAEIDENGFIHRLDIEYRAELGGEMVIISRTVSYTDVGETDVGRPRWVEGAI